MHVALQCSGTLQPAAASTVASQTVYKRNCVRMRPAVCTPYQENIRYVGCPQLVKMRLVLPELVGNRCLDT
eukprot:11016309-Karenia_brevis.AAC.1